MIVLTVLSRDGEGTCPSCGETRLLFVCHGHGLDWNQRTKTRHRCKACAIKEAGGEEHIHVKTYAKEDGGSWIKQCRKADHPAPPWGWNAQAREGPHPDALTHPGGR